MDYRFDNTERVRAAFERNARALAKRPSIGRGTAVTTVRVTDGLTCEIEEGGWRFPCDMSEKHGGTDAGPNPGTLGRGALGACLAMNYARWAAHFDVPISALTVEVEADYDAGGEYGTCDVRPGYEAIRTVVTIESEASEAELSRLLDTADQYTAFLDLFRNGTSITRDVRIRQPQTARPETAEVIR